MSRSHIRCTPSESRHDHKRSDELTRTAIHAQDATSRPQEERRGYDRLMLATCHHTTSDSMVCHLPYFKCASAMRSPVCPALQCDLFFFEFQHGRDLPRPLSSELDLLRAATKQVEAGATMLGTPDGMKLEKVEGGEMRSGRHSGYSAEEAKMEYYWLLSSSRKRSIDSQPPCFLPTAHTVHLFRYI